MLGTTRYSGTTQAINGDTGAYINRTDLTTPLGVFTDPYNTATTTTWNGSILTTNKTLPVMNNRQSKVAVFTVERNEDNKVISSKFVKELWVEIKNGASLELSVAKQLDKDFDPANTIIKEIYSVNF
jgi:hypothetical protein